MRVIGVDIGTSGVKSTLFDENAYVLAHAYREYDLICPDDGMMELDPHVLINSAMDTLREVAKNGAGKDVRAICITSYGESFVLKDGDGNILANSMIYMDKRGSREVDLFLDMYPGLEIFKKTGCFLDPMFGIYKMRWFRDNRPDILEKTKSISFIADSVAVALGADHCCDYSLASRSGMFNVREKKWWDGAMDFAGVTKDMLPEPIPGGACAGTVSKKISEDIGIPETARIILGGHDQILAAVGSGAYEQGDIANGMGTVDCITGILEGSSLQFEKMLGNNLPVVPYLDGQDMYATYAFDMSGGICVKWFRDKLAKDLTDNSDAYELLNREAPDKPTSLILIPYFGGGGTPDMDGITPAGIIGMRVNTSRGTLFRGFLEGETYEMKRNLECLSDLGVCPTRIVTVGGGSNSPLWMQIRADIFEHDVCLPANKEAGTLGSAILCYRDLGMYDSIQDAQKALIHFEATYTPSEVTRDKYRANYERYKKVLHALKEVYR